MTVYAKIENNKLITAKNGYNGIIGLADSVELCLNNGFTAYTEEQIGNYYAGKLIIENNQFVENQNYEAEQEEKEVERISNLKMLPIDFIDGLVELGISLEEINTYLETNLNAKMQLIYSKSICRKDANNLISQSFNITNEQLDNLFITKGN